MEPHGLTWARMGLHYFIDFMSEASADRGRIVCAKPTAPVFMISLPVKDWFDEEVKSALRLWQKLRCIRNPSETTKARIRAARYR